MNQICYNNVQVDRKQEILNKINDVSSEITDLREVTYKYINLGCGFFFNETIFSDLLGKGYGKNEEEKDNSKEIENAILEAGGKQAFFKGLKIETSEKISNYKNELIKLYDDIIPYNLENKFDIIRSIDSLITALNYTQNGLDAELEKAGYDHGLSKIQMKHITKKQDEYDEKLFGEKVTKNIDYVQNIYTYLNYLINKHSENITPEEKSSMEKYILELEVQADKIGGKIDKSKEYVDDLQYEDSYMEELKEMQISREDLKEIYSLYFDISGVPQRPKEGNYSGYFDGDKLFGFPISEDYDRRSGKETIKVAPHEGTHYVNWRETNENNSGVKLPGDMIKEEGLSTIIEKLISGIPLDKINYVTFSFPTVMFSNLLKGDNFLDFSGIYSKLLVLDGTIDKLGNIGSKTRRKKRGYFKDEIGGPNKDASYPIGLYEVINYLKSKKPLADLYGGKISMKDVESGNYTPKDFGNRFIYPLLISELVMFYKQNRIRMVKGNFHKEFIEHIKNKYKFLEHYFDNFSETELFTLSQRRKLLKIIKRFRYSEKEKFN